MLPTKELSEERYLREITVFISSGNVVHHYES
jgi:hypothetical protein